MKLVREEEEKKRKLIWKNKQKVHSHWAMKTIIEYNKKLV
jgi:hypothetical protein